MGTGQRLLDGERGPDIVEPLDSQISNEGNGREGNLGRATELGDELGGEVLGELVLEDGGSDGDAKDLTKSSNEAVKCHLEEKGSARARRRNRGATDSVRLLRWLQRGEDGEVGGGVDDAKSESHDDRAERGRKLVSVSASREQQRGRSSLANPSRLRRVPSKHRGEAKPDDNEDPTDELL